MERQITEELSKSSTWERVLASGGLLVGVIGIVVVRQINPTNSSLFPQCPLYTVTGLHCPGCGMTRGCHALFNGDFLTAIDYNALLPLYLFFGGYLFVSLFLTTFRGFGLKFKIFSQPVLWSFAFLALLFSILRNIPIYPLNWLAP